MIRRLDVYGHVSLHSCTYGIAKITSGAKEAPETLADVFSGYRCQCTYGVERKDTILIFRF
jgi:hypothetical protein